MPMKKSGLMKARQRRIRCFNIVVLGRSGISLKIQTTGMTVLKDMYNDKQDVGIRNNNPT